MRVEWSRHLRRVEADGTTVNLVELGSGPPLLFVHGLSGCWQNWLESLPHFARSHRVVALDLPGFGRSPLPPWQISVPRYGIFINRLCDVLGLGSCVVAGHSLGGFVATEAVLAEPTRYERQVLVAAAGVSFAEVTAERAARLTRIDRFTRPLFSRIQHAGVLRRRARRLGFRLSFHDPARLRPELLYEQLEPLNGSPGFGDAVRSVAGYDARDRLAEIASPTLIVWGREDRIVPVEAAADYAGRIPGSQLEVFEQTGHLPQLERPARFNALVEEFLG